MRTKCSPCLLPRVGKETSSIVDKSFKEDNMLEHGTVRGIRLVCSANRVDSWSMESLTHLRLGYRLRYVVQDHDVEVCGVRDNMGLEISSEAYTVEVVGGPTE